MKIYLKTVTVCAILMGSVLSSAAYAQCALKPEWIEAATRLPSIQIPAAIPVDSNTPVGRVIWRTPVPAPNPQFITNINLGRNGRLGVRAGEDRANHIWSADQRRSLRVRCNSHCGQPNATRLGNFCCSRRRGQSIALYAR